MYYSVYIWLVGLRQWKALICSSSAGVRNYDNFCFGIQVTPSLINTMHSLKFLNPYILILQITVTTSLTWTKVTSSTQTKVTSSTWTKVTSSAWTKVTSSTRTKVTSSTSIRLVVISGWISLETRRRRSYHTWWATSENSSCCSAPSEFSFRSASMPSWWRRIVRRQGFVSSLRHALIFNLAVVDILMSVVANSYMLNVLWTGTWAEGILGCPAFGVNVVLLGSVGSNTLPLFSLER